MFVEVQALQGLCYIVIPYSTKNKSSMSKINLVQRRLWSDWAGA